MTHVDYIHRSKTHNKNVEMSRSVWNTVSTKMYGIAVNYSLTAKKKMLAQSTGVRRLPLQRPEAGISRQQRTNGTTWRCF
jgi:hypothetical protein